MHITVEVVGALPKPRYLRTFDAGEDGIVALLSELCEGLASNLRFQIGGFGEERWPCTARVDLPVLLEQVPSGLAQTQERKPFELSFYEQSLQRSVDFSPVEGLQWSLHCTSFGAWQPATPNEVMSDASVVALLREPSLVFAGLAEGAYPGLSDQPLYRDWRRRVLLQVM